MEHGRANWKPATFLAGSVGVAGVVIEYLGLGAGWALAGLGLVALFLALSSYAIRKEGRGTILPLAIVAAFILICNGLPFALNAALKDACHHGECM